MGFLRRWAVAAAGLGLPLLAVLLAILAIQPFYGIVDDGALLGYVGQVGGDSFLSAWADRVRSDVTQWGMVRPFYWALAYAHYRAGAENPTVLYVVNWAVLGAVLLVAGVASARAFRVAAPLRPLYLGVFGAAVLAYPWTLDLFAFPSYQEKWVMLAAALGMLWFAESRAGLRPALWYAVSVAVIALGSLTKAQFLVFVPSLLMLAAAAQRGPDRWRRVGVVAAAGVAAAVALRLVAAQGDYTADYGLHNVPDQLGDRYLWLLAALVAAWTVYAVAASRRTGTTLWRDLTPTVTFAAFVGVFAQWPGGYLFSVIGFVLAGAFALVVTRLPGPGLRAAALVASLAVAGGWIWVRTDALYSSLSSIGEFVRSGEARQLASEATPVYISCEEGADAIAGYVRREQGLPLSVRPQDAVPWRSAKGLEPPASFGYALADSRLCPAAIDPAAWEPVWTPGRGGGFTLFRRR